ncbi:outer membrane beta-barrel protein [Nisaea acidiphila]|uniref:Outer membrane beta-barrel protein n=1 Tax=Nisaea acidiphila TaxID=1862145 RepID=A0A9J7AS01_9PROT|nr:outer membrane beta-barrel protein [Nisaea acidiphila]UUX50403.1 outer membrane beta-barrel protein [Nisaea acidiphila]
MSCLDRILTSAAICLAVAGWSTPSLSQQSDDRQNSWYFLGAETDRNGLVGGGEGFDLVSPDRRGLDEFRSGERYTFSFRYSDLGTPTGQIGLGRGPDPYGTGDVLSIYFDHSFAELSGWGVRPHMIAGMGLAYGTGLDRQEELAPAFELGVGASYAINENWDFFTEYRAFYTGRAEQSLRSDEDPSGFAQNFTLGARLRF